ncbi:MAG: DUF3108 domain-containing protein [Alphaproteobacteria bacterium]|nr:DUF3108 domain-containing protein [Alphaproteobacteria bacterium]
MVERAFNGPAEFGFARPGGVLDKPFWRRGVFLVLCLILTFGADAAEVDSRAEFVISLAGINVASLDVHFADDGSSYEVDVGANVAGVGTLVASGTASADSAGRSAASGLTARDFSLTTRARGEQFAVDVSYTSGNATAFKVSPPMQSDYGRVALERKHLSGVTDPIASFILKGSALSPDLCNRRLHIFTGMERYDLAMSFGAEQMATSARTGYQGPVVLCRVRYIPISGHYENSEITDYLAQSDKILVWYAPLGTSGYFIPYRVLMATAAGDLSMVMTKLK